VWHKLWLLLMAAVLIYTAQPLARYAKRGWAHVNAKKQWTLYQNLPGPVTSGEPWAWLQVPEANISQLILHGANKERLSRAACREVVGRAQLIMAHRDSHFSKLQRLEPGMPIHLEQRESGIKRYECSDIFVVEKDEVEALIQRYEITDALLLLTCFPFQFIGPAPSRYLVVARASS